MEAEKSEIVEDGEILNETENEAEKAKKRKREAVFEMSLFFVLGLLLGITLKTEAVKRITMGFNDYQIKPISNTYDISAMKKSLEDQAAQQSQSQGN